MRNSLGYTGREIPSETYSWNDIAPNLKNSEEHFGICVIYKL